MNFFKASNFSLPTIYNKKRYILSIFFPFCLIMCERFLFYFPSPELAYGCLNGCGWEHMWFSQELGHLCVMCRRTSRREATLGAAALHTWFVQGLSSAGKHTLRTRIAQLCLIWGEALHIFKPWVSHIYNEKGKGWMVPTSQSYLTTIWDLHGQGLVPGTELVLTRGCLWLIVSFISFGLSHINVDTDTCSAEACVSGSDTAKGSTFVWHL